MEQFMDLMKIDGKEAFVNLDFSPPAIMNKYIQQIMDGFMNLGEKAVAHTIDTRSNKRKERAKKEADFRMRHQQEIQQIQQATGVNVEDGKAFTPKSSAELDLYFGLEYKLPEESIAEKLVDEVTYENRYEETKRIVLKDLTITGLGATRTYKDVNGRIIIRRVKPENFFYSYCEYPDFRDAAFMGEMYNMKVTDFRKKFSVQGMGEKGLSEEEIYKISMAYGESQRKTNMAWSNDFYNSFYRPYDDWTIPMIYIEILTDSTIFIKKKTTRMGLPIVDFMDHKPENPGKNTKVEEKNLDKIYTGWYVRGSKYIFEWGPSKYDIRPPDNLSQQFFTYSPYLYDGYEMRNVAIPERIRPSAFQMILIHLKIQQLIAKMKPAGTIFDISGLNNITLGDGKTLPLLKCRPTISRRGIITGIP